MGLAGRDGAARSRRWFLITLPAACLAESGTKGHIFPSVSIQYSDPATEFPIVRLTDPGHTSRLPAYYNRAISRRSNSLLFASDQSGRFEAYQLDLKSGQTRQLTDAADLDPESLTLLADDRNFCYLDGGRLISANLSHLRTREVYQIPEGFQRGPGFSVAEDGQHAALVETNGSQNRLRLVHMPDGSAATLATCNEELRDPIPRPRRASVLYGCGTGVWLVNYDGQQNYQLHLAEGATGAARWSPDGRAVLYLNFPEDPHKLNNLREFTPDTNADKSIANTSQFVQFGCNSDASVFVGASASKASPYVLLLVRAVKRELTLGEHRSGNPRLVAPIFAPNSQHVFFASDQHGKPAIYSIAIEKLVEETESSYAA
jgi:oligogalacturonide lyase